MDQEVEKKLFMLRLYRFVYQLSGANLPKDLQVELESFPNTRHSYFTDSIGKAVLILMNERYDTKDLLAPIESDHFVTIAREIALKYKPLDFLKFCSWYVMKAATDPERETSQSYKTVWSAIDRVFKLASEENDGFDSENWDELDKAACKVVDEDYVKCRLIPNFDPKKKLDLKEEKAFVLRVMQHVFSLSLKELPPYYEDKLQRLDEENYHLTEHVRNALQCLVETQDITMKSLGEKGEEAVKEFLQDVNFHTTKFKVRDFLDYCTFFSVKACKDYHDSKNSSTTHKVYDSCVKILQCYREKGLPIPWGDIDIIADSIIEDNESRLTNEMALEAIRNYQSDVSLSKLKEYVPLIKSVTDYQADREEDRSDSEVGCSCCMCS